MIIEMGLGGWVMEAVRKRREALLLPLKAPHFGTIRGQAEHPVHEKDFSVLSWYFFFF